LAALESARAHGEASKHAIATLDRRIAWMLFAAGLVLRLLAALMRRTPFFSDEIQYLSIARDILSTGTHTLHIFWPAGYGYFGALILAIVGDLPRAVLIAQAVLSAAIGPIVYALALRCGFGRPASTAAAAFYLLLIQPLLMAGMMMSDTFFTAITLAALFLLIRDEGGRIPVHLAAGFLLGWAWTSRSIGAVAVLAAAAWILTRPTGFRRRIVLALCVAAALALPVGFILARNWNAHHVIALEANAGSNLWRGNNPGTDLRHIYADPVASLPGETLSQTQARVGREALGYILRNPHTFAARCLYRLSQLLGPNPGRETIYAFRDRIDLRPLAGIHIAEAICLWSIALGGLALRVRRNRVYLFCALYAAAYVAAVTAVVAAPRYRLPALPFVCVLLAGGLQGLIDLRRSGRPILRDPRVRIAGAVALLVIANLGWQLTREMPKAADPVYRNQW
jgi:hypothetical protein